MMVRWRHRTSRRNGRTDMSLFYRLSSPRADRSMFAWSAPMESFRNFGLYRFDTSQFVVFPPPETAH